MFKKMFEKFFNKKEESSIEKPLIPDFVVIPEMEELVRQYNRLGSMVFAWAHDGNLEKLELAKKDLLEAANSDMGTKLKNIYLLISIWNFPLDITTMALRSTDIEPQFL